MRLFEDWNQEQNDLHSRRLQHTSVEGCIWNALVNQREKVVASGLVIGGVTYKWHQIIQFIRKLAPNGCALGLEKILHLRSQLEIIINSPAIVTANVVGALSTVAYGLYVANGASQYLKELKTVSFKTVMDDFDKAVDKFTVSLQSTNGSAAKVSATFARLEQAVIVAQAKLTSTIRQVTYDHNEALKMKDRAKLVGHVALAASAFSIAGAIFSGVKAVQAGTAVLTATKVALSTKPAGLSFLLFAGYGACEYGSHQCQLVIDKCEQLQNEAKDTQMVIRNTHIQTKEDVEVLLEILTRSN
ncbi:unnamed protein product [Rotaria magnacalcarata]|uniref:Uncharacterized protein n=2 Tax=Rotaria magnacalcarata TaxID=392030 RepID=A0A816S2C4_9BILA|nr:unnamed protein product [Rotaria magnacalcarata]CAF4041521.1 unnamed protein product [Rotaria magnacalcarata]